MLSTIFYLIMNMGITASVIGFALIILHRMKAIPRFGAYALWSLVLVRLLIPFSFSSRVSLFNFTGSLIKKVVALSPLQHDGGLTISNAIGAADQYFPVVFKSEALKNLFDTAAIVWLIAASAALIASTVLYALTASELKKAEPLGNNIYKTDMVSTPLVFGVFKQKIIIPSSLAGDEKGLGYVLIHEKVHIKRHDNLWRIISVFIACIHWFNPFVWIFLRMFLSDMELACDTGAIKKMSMEGRKEYAGTLLNYGSGQKILMSTAFGCSKIKVRVMNVITYRKLTTLAFVFSILFITLITVVLLANPMK